MSNAPLQSVASPPADPVIRVRGLTMGYGRRILLEHADFDVHRGEVFVILGGSGCGKSTLLKTLIGLKPPLAGTIHMEGTDFIRARGAERKAVLQRMGVMYQGGALFGSMTLQENVMLPMEEFTSLPREARESIALTKLDMVGLRRFAALYPAEISGGMQKRAAIARAMALEPSILFLDEPSAGLDPVTSAGLDATILRLARNLGVTFVIVTHELSSIYSIADRCIMLEARRKRIIAEGRPQDLRDNPPDPWVRQFFRREATLSMDEKRTEGTQT